MAEKDLERWRLGFESEKMTRTTEAIAREMLSIFSSQTDSLKEETLKQFLLQLYADEKLKQQQKQHSRNRGHNFRRQTEKKFAPEAQQSQGWEGEQ